MEVKEILDFLKEFNIQTLIGVGVIVWYFNNRLERKLEKHEARTDKLYEMFIDLLRTGK